VIGPLYNECNLLLCDDLTSMYMYDLCVGSVVYILCCHVVCNIAVVSLYSKYECPTEE
jgi:hypothetical protein